MLNESKTSICRRGAAFAGLVAGLMVSLTVPSAVASEAMPVAQQNALVQKYCAVCHTDAAKNGGLSLEHFDGSRAAPSLAAMMLSKLTSGVPLETVRAAASDPSAAAVVAKAMRGGAIGAAGIPIPENATLEALINALAAEAAGATQWAVNRSQDPATKAPMTTASILRELPVAGNTDGGAVVFRLYRVVLACNAATREGEMQLAWAPIPQTGTLSATADGKAHVTYKVEPTGRPMGNGTGVAGTAAISLHESRNDSPAPRMPLPARTLTISDLFPNETVEFPFGSLPQSARQSLAGCFSSGPIQ